MILPFTDSHQWIQFLTTVLDCKSFKNVLKDLQRVSRTCPGLLGETLATFRVPNTLKFWLQKRPERSPRVSRTCPGLLWGTSAMFMVSNTSILSWNFKKKKQKSTRPKNLLDGKIKYWQQFCVPTASKTSWKIS